MSEVHHDYIEVLNGTYAGYKGIIAYNDRYKLSGQTALNADKKFWAILYSGTGKIAEIDYKPTFEYCVIPYWRLNEKWRYLHERAANK